MLIAFLLLFCNKSLFKQEEHSFFSTFPLIKMYHDTSREGGAGGGAVGPTNILARQSSNSDVIDFVTLLLLHKA